MQFIDVKNIRFATVDQGTGRPIVLVHGFPLDHTMWAGQIGGLSAAYRVIAPDLRGFGQTRPGELPDALTMDLLADDLADLLDAMAIRERIVLCGLSMGGYVAFSFYRRYAARLAGLVLCDTRAEADSTEGAAARLATANRVLAEGTGFLAEGMMPRLFSPGNLTGRPELADEIRRTVLATDPRAVAGASRGMAQRPDSTDLLPKIACPTLVLAGSHDVISPPAEMALMAQAIPNARFVEIPDAGHMSPFEQPAAVNRAIADFLAAIPAATK